jgi:hypothetical protein
VFVVRRGNNIYNVVFKLSFGRFNKPDNILVTDDVVIGIVDDVEVIGIGVDDDVEVIGIGDDVVEVIGIGGVDLEIGDGVRDENNGITGRGTGRGMGRGCDTLPLLLNDSNKRLIFLL